MRRSIAVAVAALTLAGCHKDPSDALAERVQDAADNRAATLENRADALEAQAAALDNRADQVRDTGKSRADAIKAADMNVANMTPEQRDAIVANRAAAVR